MIALVALALVQDAQQLLQRAIREDDPEILEYLVEKTVPLIAGSSLLEQALEKAKTGNAALAIVRMMRSKELLNRIVKSKHRGTGVRVEASRMLAELGSAEGVSMVMEEFDRTDLQASEKMALLKLLERKYDVDIRPALGLAASSEPPAVRRAAFSAIMLYRHKDGIEVLKKIWADGSDALRYVALGALLALDVADDLPRALDDLEAGRVREDCRADLVQGVAASRRERARDRLLEWIQAGKDKGLAAAALRVLPSYRDSRLAATIASALESPDATIRAAAAEAATEAEWTTLEVLRALLKHNRVDVRIRAARALLLRDDPAGLEVLQAESANGEWTVRRDAFRALAEAKPRAALEGALGGLTDGEERVRIWAERAVLGILAIHFPYANVDPALAGYSPIFGTDRQRETAVGRIRTWMKK